MVKFLKTHWLLVSLAILSLIVYLIYFPTIFSLNSINVKLSRTEISDKAEKYLMDRNFNLDNFKKIIAFRQNLSVIRYLQKTMGTEATNDLLHKEVITVDYWTTRYYLDLPRNISQERFQISLSTTGKLISFAHELPDTLADTTITKQSALQLCQDFIRNEIKLDLAKYNLEQSTGTKLKNRTDHFFTWVETEPRFKEAKFTIQMNVKGKQIGGFNRLFEIPTDELEKYQRTETGLNSVGISSFLLSFLILLFMSVIFLKKYHQGEIGVRHGLIFFIVVFILGIIQTLNIIEVSSQGTNIGAMPRSQVTLFMAFILIIFINLFSAMSTFMGWSIGESYAREGWSDKLSTIDGIFKTKIFTINSATAITRGYLAAFILLGFLTAFSLTAVKYLGAWTSLSHSLGSLDKSIIFLVPIIGGLLAGISNEITYRLFFVTYFKRLTKSIPIAVILSAVIFTIQHPNMSIYPVSLSMVHSFCVGLILAYLFIKYDILTTIIAGSVSIMITTGLSLFYLNHTSYFFNGAIVLIILIAPLVIAVIGFIKKEKFKYQGDDLPPHIRRISDRARMARELEIARKVQLSLLPRESPKLQGLEIFSTCIPAREVGGDYYDFVRLSDSKIGIAIGDVSGKGVPAAIYMTLTKGILQSYAEENISPKKVLSKVNKLMYKTIEHDSFVSMFYAILDIKKKVITYSRAGHNPAILFKNFNKSFKLLEPKGIGLGLEQGKLFDQTLIEEHLSLEIGDLLVFYTDGFTEAMDSFQNEYGEEKLLNIIENNSDITASNLVNKILHDVKRFVKGYPQHDDMTIVAVKVT